MNQSRALKLDLLDFLSEQEVYSTHEHLRYEADAIREVGGGHEDILSLFAMNYPVTDFRSAGASEEDVSFIQSSEAEFQLRHEVFVKFANRCKNTTQFRTLQRSLLTLYGGEILDLQTAREMNARRRERHTPGIYRSVLQEEARIKLLCRDCGETFREPEYFRTAVRMEEWLGISSINDVRKLEARTNCSIYSLNSLIDALRSEAERLLNAGAVAFKNASIYRRDPRWRFWSKSEAEDCFKKILSTASAEWVSTGTAWRADLHILQDYLFGEICNLAGTYGVPVQIHTGVPEGNILPLEWGDPTRFTDLARTFPQIKIHLLHAGHPYEPLTIGMAKMYPNVFLDCSWMHQLNAHASQFYVNWMLDEVPVWKILGFGGDYGHMEGVYGHLLQARDNFALAMAKRIENESCSKTEAMDILTEVLYENPKRMLYSRDL